MGDHPGAVLSTTAPRRCIYNDDDLQAFLESPIKKDFLHFVSVMGNACSSCLWQYDPKTPLQGLSPAMASFHGSLQVMSRDWVDDIPPISSSSSSVMIRFGNPAFKDWHGRLMKLATSIVSAMLVCHLSASDTVLVDTEYDDSILQAAMEKGREAASGSVTYEPPAGSEESVQELVSYLEDAFGHPIRLDYGTGHECSVQVFLFTACRLHLLGSTNESLPTAQRLKATCLATYHQYLAVTRRLQKDYRLEPAGSHGVWGLDDYYCLSFYFGACQLAQLSDNDNNNDAGIGVPNSIHDTAAVRDYADTYLYFGCIQFIQDIKKGVPFAESSPMLNDISQSLPTWNKVASGLLKLFEGEVLKKRPVVQHFKFGKIFSANWTPSPAPKQPPATTFTTKAPWAN
jgi:serine/threonine-protein phosphatase 2A activator